MKGSKLVSIVLAFVCVSASALADKTDTLQDALKGIMHQHKIPDLSFGVIRSGKIVYAADLTSAFCSSGVQPDVEPFRNGQLIPQDQHWPFDPQFFPVKA